MGTLTIIALLAVGVVFLLDAYALIDISNRKFLTHSEKRKWFNAVILMPVVGAWLYFFRRKNKKARPEI